MRTILLNAAKSSKIKGSHAAITREVTNDHRENCAIEVMRRKVRLSNDREEKKEKQNAHSILIKTYVFRKKKIRCHIIQTSVLVRKHFGFVLLL